MDRHDLTTFACEEPQGKMWRTKHSDFGACMHKHERKKTRTKTGIARNNVVRETLAFFRKRVQQTVQVSVCCTRRVSCIYLCCTSGNPPGPEQPGMLRVPDASVFVERVFIPPPLCDPKAVLTRAPRVHEKNGTTLPPKSE